LSNDGYTASLEARKIYVALRVLTPRAMGSCASLTSQARSTCTHASASCRRSCRADCSRRWP